MPERQVSLQELESKLDSYIHDVENSKIASMIGRWNLDTTTMR